MGVEDSAEPRSMPLSITPPVRSLLERLKPTDCFTTGSCNVIMEPCGGTEGMRWLVIVLVLDHRGRVAYPLHATCHGYTA